MKIENSKLVDYISMHQTSKTTDTLHLANRQMKPLEDVQICNSIRDSYDMCFSLRVQVYQKQMRKEDMSLMNC